MGAPTHRLSYEPEYDIWCSMIARCTRQGTTGYEDYGGRGISVCKSWLDSFPRFYADMGPRPSAQHSIDRFPNNDGNYEPGNCRWATRKQQQRNRSDNRQVVVGDVAMTLAEWSEKTGIPSPTIRWRLNQGWRPIDAVSKPGSIVWRNRDRLNHEMSSVNGF